LSLAITGVLGTATPLFANSDNWIGPPGGNWSNPLNWSPTGVPAAGDNVLFYPIGSGSYTDDGSYPSDGALDDVFVGNGSNSTPTLIQSSTTINATLEAVHSGTFNQTGGINNAGLTIGGADGTGTYILGGGSVSSPHTSLGADGGFGAFLQSDGSSSLGGLNMGLGTGSSGVASLSAGSLSASFIEAGVEGGIGTFLQSGGSSSLGKLTLGTGSGSSGVASMSVGSLTAAQTIVGDDGGFGAFDQSGGSSNLGSLAIGNGNGAFGTVAFSAGSLTAAETFVGGNALGGGYGFGTFLQSGSLSASNLGTLVIGNELGSSGTLSLSAGFLTALSNYVGDVGAGTFLQSGSFTVCSLGSLTVGAFSGLGTFALSGGTLNVSGGLMYVGWAGAGTFLQSGSLSASIFGTIDVADGGSQSSGRISLSGGLLTASVTNVASDPYNSNGVATFAQSGGSANLGQLSVAAGTGAYGTVAFSGGSLSASSTVVATDGGVATFSQSGNVSLASLGTVQIGSTGTLTLAGGTMDVQSITSAGTLHITGGTLAIIGVGSLGAGSIASTGLKISGSGVLDVGSSALVIEYGTGTSPVGDLSFAHTARNYPANSIQRYAQTAIDNLNWDGPGLSSSFAENDPTGLTAVGIADENDLGIYPTDYTIADGGTGTWMGQPINDTNNVLVRMTYYGDGNLDGVVNRFDVTALVEGYSGLAGYVGWSDGDYNYDGRIDRSDVSLLAESYIFQGAPLGDAITAGQAQYLLALDPDPRRSAC